MASNQGSHNHGSAQVPGQAQMRRDQPSDLHSQDHETSFIQETGSQMTNMAQGVAHGASNMAQGAAQGAANIAKGAAAGAATFVQGAADAVKVTLGMNSPNDNSSNCPPNNPQSRSDSNTPNDPSWPNNTTHGSSGHPGNPRI